jgi:hypothetical protein
VEFEDVLLILNLSNASDIITCSEIQHVLAHFTLLGAHNEKCLYYLLELEGTYLYEFLFMCVVF